MRRRCKRSSPSVRRSVPSYFGRWKVRLLGASCAVYPALFFIECSIAIFFSFSDCERGRQKLMDKKHHMSVKRKNRMLHKEGIEKYWKRKSFLWPLVTDNVNRRRPNWPMNYKNSAYRILPNTVFSVFSAPGALRIEKWLCNFTL